MDCDSVVVGTEEFPVGNSISGTSPDLKEVTAADAMPAGAADGSALTSDIDGLLHFSLKYRVPPRSAADAACVSLRLPVLCC